MKATAMSPVYWNRIPLPEEQAWLITAMVGQAFTSIMLRGEEANADLSEWAKLAECTLIRINLDYPVYCPDHHEMIRMMGMLRGGRRDRSVRCCGNFLRTDETVRLGFSPVGTLYSMWEDGVTHLVDVDKIRGETFVTMRKSASELDIVRYLRLHYRQVA